MQQRIDRLERINRRNSLLLAGLTSILAFFVVAGFSRDPQDPIKTRMITIVDEQGRSRIVLAGTIPDPLEGKRRTTGPGMQILDSKGYEQIGLHVDEQGSVGLGLDARPGVGDGRNRERINMWVSPEGSPGIRLMDGRTRVKSMWFLDEAENAWIGFDRWSEKDQKVKYEGMKKIGLTTVEEKPDGS